MAERDQEFVEFVVKAVVESPDKVEVKRTIDERGVLLELTVDPSDMGKVIGREGRTAKAIRTLLRVLGAQNDARVNLKIIEPEGGTGGAAKEVAKESPAETDVPKATTKEADVPEATTKEADVPETTTKEDLQEIDQE